MFSKNVFFLVLFVLAVFTRFLKIDWGNDYFFHPDENNMATAITQMDWQNLNPHFFAYGQFPLYLTFFSLKILHLSNNFSNAVLSLRFWSAFFSLLSLLFFYLIAQKFFKKIFLSFIFLLLLIFNPGLIQLAHFGTTESLLILVFSINLFLGLKLNEQLKFKYIFYAALVSGIGLATKITAIFFILPILLSLFLIFLRSKNKSIVLFTVCYLLFTTLFSIIFSPFNVLAFSEFKSSMQYETAVATGNIKVFYTHQFLNTTPYFFQFTKIFPYVSGLPVFILAIIGFVIFILNTRYFILLIPCLVYFLYNGQLFIKWTRFMSPLFFIFPFFATYFISKIKNKLLIYFLVLISIIPGIYFLNLYIRPDIRVIASDWIYKNIPQNSIILSESGNVINLPINSSKYDIANFDFYNFNQNELSSLINKSEYIFVPSRRVFKNNFLDTQNYYQNLFSGRLGFQEIKNFSVKTDPFLNPENAEETWTVFDSPTIRIYKKTKQLSIEEIKNILK